MKKFYKELLEELISSGELSPVSREKVWERFERLYGKETGKRKRLELELNSLKKTQESWNTYTPVSKELLKQTEDVLDTFLHEKREEIEKQANKFHETFHAEQSEDENIYLCYLKQSVRYLEILLDDASLEEDVGVPSENGELEVDEYDTSYCASLMWKYQDMEADEITRKRRQAEFWVWYIKEAARLCDDPIKERIKVESFIPDTPILEIKNAQDFVRAINSELDYIKHEKMNDKIILRIYTRKHKKGLTYPACGRHSEHIKISSEAVSKLGKFKEWAVELRTEIHLYYCDNQDCPEKSFPDRTEVGLNEEKANFLYITNQKENEKIIHDLFGLS